MGLLAAGIVVGLTVAVLGIVGAVWLVRGERPAVAGPVETKALFSRLGVPWG